MSLICIVAIDSAIIGRAEFRLGKTAYYGWVTYVRPRIKKVRDSRFVYAETTLKFIKGAVLFVATDAGPVGSYVSAFGNCRFRVITFLSCSSIIIQLAKSEGLKVIASAGSDDKIQFMKECGADMPSIIRPRIRKMCSLSMVLLTCN